MCIAIWKPADARIDRATLRRCYDGNQDGAGFAWAAHGKVYVRKGFFTWATFEAGLEFALQDILKAHSGLMLHFRIKTHGAKDTLNCHPHRINKTLAFCHNGVLWETKTGGAKSDAVSDTIQFRDHVIKNLPPDWQNYPVIQGLLQEYIGSYNKMIFLNGAGRAIILNEKQGTWADGVWYSNDGFKPAKQYHYKGKPGPSTRRFYYGGDGWDDGEYGKSNAATTPVTTPTLPDFAQGTGQTWTREDYETEKGLAWEVPPPNRKKGDSYPVIKWRKDGSIIFHGGYTDGVRVDTELVLTENGTAPITFIITKVWPHACLGKPSKLTAAQLWRLRERAVQDQKVLDEKKPADPPALPPPPLNDCVCVACNRKIDADFKTEHPDKVVCRACYADYVDKTTVVKNPGP